VHDDPAPVSILRHGPYLVASTHTALDDSQLMRFRADLLEAIGLDEVRAVIIDVGALDVLDSFGSRAIHDIAQVARLRGAVSVVVGIRPDVAMAMAMASLGMSADSIDVALDLEEGLGRLDKHTRLIGGCLR
jgi:rsbT antagonist protein RsbS